jgi:hypothetical protein
MRDGDFRVRGKEISCGGSVKRWLAIGVVVACGKSNAPASRDSAAPPAAAISAESAGGCPATGAWAECSVVYRLERAGLAPKVDSTAKPEDPSLGGQPLVIKIGLNAVLEIHLYADSASRIAAAAKLDRSELVGGTQPQTIKRERTLIESANLVALLTSINSHQRERVSDALSAGPPQPTGGAQPVAQPPSAG